MPEGVYYIIGGIKGGKRIRETIVCLTQQFTAPASILYIGAAHNNDYGNELGFMRGFKDRTKTKLRIKSLHLSDDCQNSESHNVEYEFGNADIIFFDGGEIDVLRRVFDRYKLKDHCKKAFDRGACVGGLCAGGSYFGSSVIHSGIESDELRVDIGLGLIRDTAITCYIGDRAQAHRLAMLENRSYQATETGLGVPVNQAITWNSQSGFRKLFPDTMGAVIYKPD